MKAAIVTAQAGPLSTETSKPSNPPTFRSPTRVVPLSEIETVWEKAPTKPRVVLTVG
jgi:hypothetical protein